MIQTLIGKLDDMKEEPVMMCMISTRHSELVSSDNMSSEQPEIHQYG